MGRTAGQFCSRESMFRFQNDLMSSKSTPLDDTVKQPESDAMTWQQQKDFGPAVVSEITVTHTT